MCAQNYFISFFAEYVQSSEKELFWAFIEDNVEDLRRSKQLIEGHRGLSNISLKNILCVIITGKKCKLGQYSSFGRQTCSIDTT